MKIAVTETGKEDRTQFYLDWLQSINAEAQLVVVSYKGGVTGLESFDGLVLTGGEDLNPSASKAEPAELIKKIDTKRDDFEFNLLRRAFTMKLPVLGICRGLQLVNVLLGGTLVADLPNEGFVGHEIHGNETRHALAVYPQTIMYKLTGQYSGEVNSFHHQAVKELASSLHASSVTNDGIIESLEWKEKEGKSFLVAVQWHPERMKDTGNPFAKRIGEGFLDSVQIFQMEKITL